MRFPIRDTHILFHWFTHCLAVCGTPWFYNSSSRSLQCKNAHYTSISDYLVLTIRVLI